MSLTLAKARFLANQVIEEINNDPIQLIKIGCSEIEISEKIISEVMEHTIIAAEFVNVNYENYFKHLLFEVIKGYKDNGKEYN